MRAVRVVLFAVLMSACTGSSDATPDTHRLSELLPASLGGVDTTRVVLPVAARTSPKIFLKTVGRLNKTPPDGELALASSAGSNVYAFRVDGVSGFDILETFTAEVANVTAVSVPEPTTSVGGKLVTPVGELPGTYLYSSGDVFYYIECTDDPTAADALSQLP